MTDPKDSLRALGKTIERAADVIEDRIEDATQESRAIEPLVNEARRLPWWGHARRFWPLLLIGILALAFVFSGAWRQLHLERLDDHYALLLQWSTMHPVLFRLALVAALAGITAIGMPGGAVLIIAGGVVLGAVECALYAVFADGIGSSLLYLAARRAMDGDAHRPTSAMVEKLRSGFNAHPISYALFLRLVPVFPFGAVSVALAWLGCRYRMFLATSMIGVFPSLLIYAAIGSSLAPMLAAQQKIDASLLGQPRFLLPLLALAVLSLIPVLLGLKRAPRVPR